MSPLLLLILAIWISSLICFMAKLAKGLSKLLIFSKNQLLILLIFLSILHFINFNSNHFYFLLLFLFYFSSFLRRKVRLLILSLLKNIAVSSHKFSSKHCFNCIAKVLIYWVSTEIFLKMFSHFPFEFFFTPWLLSAVFLNFHLLVISVCRWFLF